MNAKRCPKLKELPKPPQGKTGWPWTEESPQLPDTMPDGNTWPKISIVTPSLNQGQFIEETIRSVLLQGYPELEYIIIDGGSTDETLNIIKKYEPWITHWISEPDRGQANALNKGFARATGEIFAYINSDDLYEPGSFEEVSQVFAKNKDVQLVAGECICFNEYGKSRMFDPWWPERLDYFVSKTYSSTFAQPAAFWSKKIHQKVGGFDVTLHYCFDRDFFLRIGMIGVSPYILKKRLSRFREHSDSKSMGHSVRFHEESILILDKHAERVGLSNRKKRQITNRTNIEIRYIRVFERWKESGRIAGIFEFFTMALLYPASLLDRKVLGQARRLFFFPARNVEELNS